MEDTSIAKLFEEVKLMFKDLPSRIDRKLDPETMLRRRRRFHPGMWEELMHHSFKLGDPYMGFLLIISLCRDDMPWLYEMGMETYRTLKASKTKSEKQKALSSFSHSIELLHHPMFYEMGARSEEAYIMTKEIMHLMPRLLNSISAQDS